MALSWSYEDYIEYEYGSATRLSKLRSHIREVSNYLRNPGKMALEGRDIEYRDLKEYIKDLRAEERELASLAAGNSGVRFFNTTQPGTR